MPLRKKILVVEDDPDLRAEVAHTIAGLGVSVVEASDGAEGLERLRDGGAPPDAILLDMRGPRLGGQGFLRALRGDPRLELVPVITMTGGPEPAWRGQRPYDVEELARLLVSLCG